MRCHDQTVYVGKQGEQLFQTSADSGEKQRLFGEFPYAAGTWDRSRRVIVKAEHAARGANPRYIVTSLKDAPQYLYDTVFCARGDMENRIKEQQLDLFADRTSCHEWWPNQHRVLLSALAYVLLDAIRRIALQNDQDIAAHNPNTASNDPAPARLELSRPATTQISRIPAKSAHSCNIRASQCQTWNHSHSMVAGGLPEIS